MENQKIKSGDILASRYTYGDEILHWKFYMVVGFTEKRIKLQPLKGFVTYDDGRSGPHYYNDPTHISPINPYTKEVECEGKEIVRAYRYSTTGELIVKTEDYYTSRGKWNSEPLVCYNLH